MCLFSLVVVPDLDLKRLHIFFNVRHPLWLAVWFPPQLARFAGFSSYFEQLSV